MDWLVAGYGDKTKRTSTQKRLARKEYIKKSPMQQMLGSQCCRGRSKRAEDAGEKICGGRVIQCDEHDEDKEKKKQKKAAQIVAAAAAQSGKQKGGKQPAKPSGKAAGKAGKAGSSALMVHLPQRISKPRQYRQDNGSVAGRVNGSEYGEDDYSTPAARAGAELEVGLGLDTEEEVELAIQQGYLPDTYKTQLCSSALDGSSCPLGPSCEHAHTLVELRVEAAIQLGILNEDYKTMFCDEFNLTAACPHGITCGNAHSVEELRIAKAIELGRLAPNYKTECCPQFDKSGTCSNGLVCTFAHGATEVRQEAAVQAGLLPPNYKTTLCAEWQKKRACTLKDKCHFAHGVKDLRFAAAYMIPGKRKLPNTYKTVPCSKAHCDEPPDCWSYHGPHDQLLPRLPRSQMCPIQKELGECPDHHACFYAHAVQELQGDVSYKFRKQPHPPAVAGPSSSAPPATAAPPSMKAAPAPDEWQTVASKVKKKEIKIVPLSVQQHRLPVAPGVSRSKGKAPAKKAPELLLCPHVQDMGRCPVIGCEYAHSEEEIQANQQKIREAEVASRAAKAEQERVKRAASQARAEVHRAAAAANAAPVIPTIKLREPVLAAMKRHKLKACVGSLVELGFDWTTAEGAARASGASVQVAAQLLFDGTAAGFGEKEVTIEEEGLEVAQISEAMGIGQAEVEAQILRYEGDHEAALGELQRRKLEGEAGGGAGSSSSPERAGHLPLFGQDSWSEASEYSASVPRPNWTVPSPMPAPTSEPSFGGSMEALGTQASYTEEAPLSPQSSFGSSATGFGLPSAPPSAAKPPAAPTSIFAQPHQPHLEGGGGALLPREASQEAAINGNYSLQQMDSFVADMYTAAPASPAHQPPAPQIQGISSYVDPAPVSAPPADMFAYQKSAPPSAAPQNQDFDQLLSLLLSN
ncbi:hypothetical protein WJX72_000891 [[Myrmecia] bisecta]|uniref:Uncharacterized protein n=1 Tax=[Myrmecia] bisecta TaxID=41462 RepID=A0AAW1PZ98_9CHLO